MSDILNNLQSTDPTKYKQILEYGKLIIKSAKEQTADQFKNLWENCMYKAFLEWHLSQAFRIVLSKFVFDFVSVFIDCIKPNFKCKLYAGIVHYYVWNCRERHIVEGGVECKILERLFEVFDPNEVEYAYGNSVLHVAFLTKQFHLAMLILKKGGNPRTSNIKGEEAIKYLCNLSKEEVEEVIKYIK